MLSEEQTEKIKKQVIEQIGSTFPEEKKIEAINQIESMNSEQFEKFLEQNKLMQQNQESKEGQCIFCLINSGKTPTYKLDESKNAIAVLEINPISKAHSLIIPKKHESKKIQKNILNFAEKISKKIKTKFKPKEIILSESNLLGHKTINLIPVYENETIDSERYKAEKSELEDVQKTLAKEQKKRPAKKKEKLKGDHWLPKRIP